MKTLVLGIGNELLSDEGVGIHVARALSGLELPSDVSIVEAGTAFLDVLAEIEGAERIVIIDAMEAGEAPGTVYRMPFHECRHPNVLMSLHGFDLSRVLYMAGNERKPEAIVYGIEPEHIAWGMELSPAVRRAVTAAAQAIAAELRAMQPARAPGGGLSGLL